MRTVDFQKETRGRDGSNVSPWLRYRGTSQKDGSIGKNNMLFSVFGNVTQLSDGTLNVLFDAGSQGPGSQPFTATENPVMAVEKDGTYDFIILTNGGVPGQTEFTTVFALSRSPTFAYGTEWTDFLTKTGFTNEIYEVPHPPDCYYGGPGVSPDVLDTVDLKKLSGFWYQHRIDIAQLQFQGKETICAALQYDLKMDGANKPYLLDTAVSQAGPGKVGPNFPVSKFNANVTQTKGGYLVVHFPAGTLGPNVPAFDSPTWVTDAVEKNGRYDMYIGTGGAEAFTSIFLNTRQPTLLPEYEKQFLDRVSSSHFWVDLYNVSQPKECSYRPLVNPVPLPDRVPFNTTMAAG